MSDEEDGFEAFKPKNPKAELLTQPPAGIEPWEFRGAVVAACSVYSAHGVEPTAQNMLQFGVIAMNKLRLERIMRTDEFAIEMTAKGVPWNNHSQLTTEQLQCLEVITNPTRRGTIASRLASIKVTPTQYKLWKKNPVFEAQLKALTSNVLTEWQGEMDTALVNLALDGKLDAIRYANEVSGRHDPNRNQAINMKAFVDFVIQTIHTHVKDPEQLMSIANDLQTYMVTQSDTPKQGSLVAEYKKGIIDG